MQEPLDPQTSHSAGSMTMEHGSSLEVVEVVGRGTRNGSAELDQRSHSTHMKGMTITRSR